MPKKSPQQTSFNALRARSPRRTPSDRQPLIRQCHVTHPTVLHAHSRLCPRPGQAFLRSTHACLLTGHETLARPTLLARNQTWERCRRLPSCQQCPSRPSWRDEPILAKLFEVSHCALGTALVLRHVRTCRRPLRSRAAARRSRSRGSFDVMSSVTPPLAHVTVVTSEPKVRKLSPNAESHPITSTRNNHLYRLTS